MSMAGNPLLGIANATLMRIWYGPIPPRDGAYRRSVLWAEEGSEVARATLASGLPCMIARLGSSELACLSFFTRWRRLGLPYPAGLRRTMRVNAGVFSNDDASLDRLCSLYLDSLSRVDVIGVWFNRNEHRIVQRYCPQARLVHLEALNCVIRENPWSAALEGRRVLVVHPFAKTIESQYRTRRGLLFANPRVLPEFELQTIAAVQSLGGAPCGYETWFDALEAMRRQIEAAEFDVAIIGAGAYGLPLAAAVKDMGRQAVHLGGATQLLFGIRGRRWEIESPDDIAPLFNEHWVRPSAEETPESAGLVEGGCYW